MIKKFLILLSCITQATSLSALDLNSMDSAVTSVPVAAQAQSVTQEIVIDAVVASVDGVPITLKDLEHKVVKIKPSAGYKNLNVAMIKSDPFLTSAAEQMITENLLQAEAEKRKIRVSENDVERYIDQVAKQNNLSRSEFENALQQQGQNINAFAAQAKIEVIRSKIMGQLAQSAPAVTDEELGSDAEEDAKTEDLSQGLRYKLKEIFLPKSASLEDKVGQVSEALEDGQDFAAVAAQFSAGNGGDLGLLAEADLSEQIKSAVADLEPLQYSEPVTFDDGVRFFFLESKLEEGESEEVDDSKKAMLRKELESRKLAKHFEQFFEKDIFKNHKIERKF